MTENVPCEDCGEMTNFKDVHPHRTTDDKPINFCESCCPNCYGGKGNDRYNANSSRV